MNLNYQTSKDYEKLFELIKTQKIIAILKSKSGLKEICWSKDNNKDDIAFYSRGIIFIHVIIFGHETEDELKKEFIKQCEEAELEYLPPIEV